MNEIKHHYGKNIHLLDDPYGLSLLAKLCSEETTQPLVNELITQIYTGLLRAAISGEIPRKKIRVKTRMVTYHPDHAILNDSLLDPEARVISVNLARAGTLPSHVCYSALNYLLQPKSVRQDHISIARVTNQSDQVTGSTMGGVKIGGPIDGATVLIPDPMAATGSTLVEILDLYKSRGKAAKYIALHCIVTPEYLKKLREHHPDLVVYALRVDRGLSSSEILASEPGLHWDRERGLNDKQYIVPGGGGFGEILNNADI